MQCMGGVSLVVEGLEDLLATQTWHFEVALVVCGHEAGVEELLDEVRGDLAFLDVFLHHLHLLLEYVVVGDLCLGPLLFQGAGLLLFLDLLLGTSPLAADLQEVRRHSL